MNNDHFIKLPELFSGSQFQSRAQILGETTLPISTQTYDFTKSKGYGIKLVKNGSILSNLIQICQNWFKLVKIYSNLV